MKTPALPDNKKKQIMFIKYEYIVEKTNSAIDEISKFLGTNKSKFMDEIIVKENCPNVIDVAERDEKKKIIFNKATNKYYRIIEDLEKKYEQSGNYFK